MTTVRSTLCLLILMTLTTTWARTFLDFTEASPINKIDNDNATMQKKLPIDTSIESKLNNDRVNDYYKRIVRKYLQYRANELMRKDDMIGRRSRSLRGNDEKGEIPFSERRLEKMLEKAILKIITGDLSTADMLLLKSLNYSLDEVLAIRERELGKKIDKSDGIKKSKKSTEKVTIMNHESMSERSSRKLVKENRLEGEKSARNDDTDRSIGSKTKQKIPITKTDEDFDFEAYNRQAVYDYENAANNVTQQLEIDPIASTNNADNQFVDARENVDDDLHANFDRAMESHVVFKIRYDDSDIDSRSDEKAKQLSREKIGSTRKRPHYDFIAPIKSRNRNVETITTKSVFSSSTKFIQGINSTPENFRKDTFHETSVDMHSSLPVIYRLGNFVDPTEEIEIAKDVDIVDGNSSMEVRNDSASIRANNDEIGNNDFSNDFKRGNVYEGLEWVEDDVYRVIPDAIDTLDYDGNAIYYDNETIDDTEGNDTRDNDLVNRIGEDDVNDTLNYQNENPDYAIQTIANDSSVRNQSNSTLSAYQQLALAHRRDRNVTTTYDSQGQKAIEDIKLKVLAMTGRFNLSSSSNQVQRERLTMFSPICQMPRNTDSEAWTDAFSMNMHFHLNLSSDDHVVAAKLRIYKLPQDNVTLTNSAAIEEVDEEEKKIRISVYFYTKSLKKHRAKKRLMDSVVTALTTQGNHLALDVRQALRFWRQNLRNSHSNGNNHGLVIQVEDQDGRPLKPSQYIEQDSCHGTERNEDDKAYQRVPALFVQACARYVRVVNGEAVTYVNCSKSSRNGRH